LALGAGLLHEKVRQSRIARELAAWFTEASQSNCNPETEKVRLLVNHARFHNR
jgi:hypothetical protein